MFDEVIRVSVPGKSGYEEKIYDIEDPVVRILEENKLILNVDVFHTKLNK